MRRQAISLIEVLASLTLLAVTTAALFAAQGRAWHQLAAAHERNTAADLAQELITSWKLDSAVRASSATGEFPQAAGWHWSREVQPYAQAPGLLEITLHVHRRQSDSTTLTILTYTWLEKPSEP